MERGLLWLPLLIAFIWLTWSGWNEYQKLEAYKIWAQEFDNAKFDIYAVLGKKARQLTWGKPTRKGMIDLKSFSLDKVKEMNLYVGNQRYSQTDLDSLQPEELPQKGKATLEFDLIDQESVQVPFTDVTLAAKWFAYLRKSLSA